MNIHWKDIQDDKGNWSHLLIEIANQPEGKFQIYSGGNQRFKLAKGDLTLFWGCVEHDYNGAWMLRNDIVWVKESMIIPPISSSQVESSKSNNLDFEQFWSRFYLNALSSSPNSILYNGKWKITTGNVNWKNTTKASETVYSWDKAFSEGKLCYIDWGINGSGNLLSLKEVPFEGEGRVKYWRKEVKKQACPPILIWYINSLDAFVIIDGHCRLKACLLEELEPKFLVINSVEVKHFEPDVSMQKNILQSIEKRQNHPYKQKLNVEEINKLLIGAYDNRPIEYSIIEAVAQPDFEQKWLDEVSIFRTDKKVDQEELEAMIKNK